MDNVCCDKVVDIKASAKNSIACLIDHSNRLAKYIALLAPDEETCLRTKVRKSKKSEDPHHDSTDDKNLDAMDLEIQRTRMDETSDHGNDNFDFFFEDDMSKGEASYEDNEALSMDSEISELQKQIEELQKVDEKMQVLEHEANRKGLLSKSWTDEIERLKKTDQLYEQCKTQHDQCQSELAALKQNHEEASCKIKEQSELIEALVRKNKDLKHDIEQANTRFDGTLKELKQQTVETEKLQRQNAGLKREAQTWKRKYDEVERARGDLEEALSKSMEYDSENNSAVANRSNATALSSAATKEQSRESFSCMERAAELLESLLGQKSSPEQGECGSQASRKKCQEQLENLIFRVCNEKTFALMEELEAQREKGQELVAEVSKYKEQAMYLTDTQEQNEKLKANLEVLKRKTNDLLEEMNDLRSEAAHLSEIRSERDSMRKTVADLEQENTRMRRELETRLTAQDNDEESSKRMTDDLAFFKQKSKKLLTDINLHIQREQELAHEIQLYNQQIHESKQEASKWKRKAEEMTNIAEECKKAIIASNVSTEKHRNEAVKSTSEADLQRKLAQTLAAEVDKGKAEAQRLSSELEDYKKKATEVAAEAGRSKKLIADVVKWQRESMKVGAERTALQQELQEKNAAYDSVLQSRIQYQKAVSQVLTLLRQRTRDKELVADITNLVSACESSSGKPKSSPFQPRSFFDTYSFRRTEEVTTLRKIWR